MSKLHLLALFALLAPTALARPELTWTLAKSEHFELYTQAGPESARPALRWFESLHAFFSQRTGSKLAGRLPIRVIAFRSRSDYQESRLRRNADAYYVSLNDRDYIVLPMLSQGAFALAAHEFAHLAAHASGLQLPPWLSEGLAEIYSTLQIGEARSDVGGDRPAQTQLLTRQSWMPLPQLLNLTAGIQTTLFYAQSWALTEMLVLSPAYGPRFEQLKTALGSGTLSVKALTDVYSKSLAEIETDLRTWVHAARPWPAKLPGVSVGYIDIQISAVATVESRAVIAELLFATGELDRAETLYRELPQTAPSYAALGAIALRRGDRDEARALWKKALALGLADATLCYRYAVLAEEAGLPADEIRPALQRVVALNPDHEDARYSLALLENNVGRYEEALAQWNAIMSVRPSRAFDYWSAMANAYNELGRREEAQAAARQALAYARTPPESARARQLAFIAQTDLAVQFASDANGQTRMVTTRSPHGAEDWNPFVEPGDDMRRIEGKLASLECTGLSLQISVLAASGRFKLRIPDTSRVQMRNAPAEFTCGPQPVTPVIVDYNSDGVVRGMRFTALSSSR